MRRLRNPARSSSLNEAVSMPSKKYSPLEGLSRQPRILSRVDFPAPEGPVIVSHSPASKRRWTSTSAWTTGSLPNSRPTPFSSSTCPLVFAWLAIIRPSHIQPAQADPRTTSHLQVLFPQNHLLISLD